MTLNEELLKLRRQVKEQKKEIRYLKREDVKSLYTRDLIFYN